MDTTKRPSPGPPPMRSLLTRLPGPFVPPIHNRQPFKHPVYPVRKPLGRRSVTVCIAAICRENDEERIILCADTRLSAAEWGSTDMTLKMHSIGPGWVSLAAGRPDSASELIARIRERFTVSHRFRNTSSMLTALQKAVKEFSASPLFEPRCCELLVTGFINNKAVIVPILFAHDDSLCIRLVADYFVIGSGGNIASVILNCRDYSKSEEIGSAVYLVYEAKKLSEKADGVGPMTTIAVFRPWSESAEPGVWMRVVGVSGMLYLDSILDSRGIRRRPVMDDLPEQIFDFI